MNNKSTLFSTALLANMRGYNFLTFKHDLLAGFVVSLVALPLAMALAIAVGLPPQHGIYTAIIAGIVVPLLGGSIWQVSGPTAAFVVILAPIVSEFGLRGIIWSGILAGIILIGLGISRLGKLVNYIPYPVTTGFTAGIAMVLATLSLNDFLGLGISSLDGEYIYKVITIASHIKSVNPYAVIIGVTTLFLLFTTGRIIRFLPSAVIAMLIGTLLAIIFTRMGVEIATIGSQFSYMTSNGNLMPGIPPYPPILHWPTLTEDSLFTVPNLNEFRQLLFPAFTIAILAALESLLSATVADSMTGTKHNPNVELNGIGIGNILSALAGGIPATGAIARTATNINNGAKTPLAATIHGLFILLYVLLLAPYIQYIPMAALAALLIHTAYRMSHYRQFIRILQIAPKSDIFVLIVCFLLTVFVDMVVGVGFGIICAAFLVIKRITALTHTAIDKSGDNNTTTNTLPANTFIYRVQGPLFFGTIEKVFDRSNFAFNDVKHFIIDISGVPFIDMTGLVAMSSLLNSVANNQRVVYIVGGCEKVTTKLKKKMRYHPSNNYVKYYQTLNDIPVLHCKRNNVLSE